MAFEADAGEALDLDERSSLAQRSREGLELRGAIHALDVENEKGGAFGAAACWIGDSAAWRFGSLPKACK